MILRFKTLLGMFVLFGFFACGGGGSLERDDGTNTGGGGTTTDPITRSVQLAFTSVETGEPSIQLSEATPLRLTATATNSKGEPVADSLITYTFQPEGLAVFGNDSGTARTNTSGVAIIDILVGENSGAGEITATLSSGETATTTYDSAGTVQVNTQPSSLDLFSSSIQLASSGSDKIELLALVKDVNNVLLEGVEVTFSADADASLQQTQVVTGADGIARALLSTQNKPENRIINASVTVGTLNKEIEINVVGTEVVINGPPSVILGQSADFTILLADSDGTGIANQPVVITSQNGNAFNVSELVTDVEGQVTVSLTANNSGVDVITASAINATGTLNISVQQDSFGFTSVTEDDIPLGQSSSLDLTWLKESSPFAGGTISFTTTRGELSISSVITDADGVASVQIQSDNAGKALISAQGEDSDGNIVNARTEVEFIATEVDNIIVSASSSSIGPAGQKSTITAILRDPDGNLVKGKTVSFNADDVSSGEIFPAEAVTDSNGIASAVFTSNTVTKENGITITVTETDSGLFASTELTIADRAQFISIGTGNEIEAPDETSYLKKFTVFVTDANSNPVSGVDLTITGTPVKYSELLEPNAEAGDPNYQVIRPAFYKGYWSPYPDADSFEFWVPVQTIGCANEDVDGDAILDPNEDINGNGNLTPGNILSIDGNVTTDENGQAIVELRYAKTFAAWGQVKITASTPVSGSESKASQFYTLGASAADLQIETTRPNSNPFGTGTNIVEDPNNPGTFIDDGSNLTCSNVL